MTKVLKNNSSNNPQFYNESLPPFPSGKILKKMDLLNDQDGIIRRYRNEQTAWNSHLNNTKDFIKNCFPFDQNKTVAVLGSGWMLDVPAVYLLENFKEVAFYDIRHPQPVLDQFKEFNNVYFIEADLTGGLIEKAYSLCSHWKKMDSKVLLNQLKLNSPELSIQADYIFLVNLLNQLDILIIDYLKKFYRIDSSLLHTLRARIQDTHIRTLPKSRSCLITDYDEIHLNDQDIEKGNIPLIHCDLPKGSRQKNWIWQFDTCKTYDPNWRTNLKVIALKL